MFVVWGFACWSRGFGGLRGLDQSLGSTCGSENLGSEG